MLDLFFTVKPMLNHDKSTIFPSFSMVQPASQTRSTSTSLAPEVPRKASTTQFNWQGQLVVEERRNSMGFHGF